MQKRSYIFNSLFALILVGLHLQPLFINHQATNKPVTENTCSKQGSCSKKKKCSDEPKNCRNQGCNPFLPCTVGTCCYLVENFFAPSEIPMCEKQNLALINDNKILKAFTECWHPPEPVS